MQASSRLVSSSAKTKVWCRLLQCKTKKRKSSLRQTNTSQGTLFGLTNSHTSADRADVLCTSYKKDSQLLQLNNINQDTGSRSEGKVCLGFFWYGLVENTKTACPPSLDVFSTLLNGFFRASRIPVTDKLTNSFWTEISEDSLLEQHQTPYSNTGWSSKTLCFTDTEDINQSRKWSYNQCLLCRSHIQRYDIKYIWCEIWGQIVNETRRWLVFPI